MSDAQNLNDFFAQNSRKKKQTKKPAAAKAKPATAVETHEEEIKEETTPAVQPEQQPPAQDFADSSDDESNTIVLNEGRQKVIDRKDLEASKKNNREEDSSDAVGGWGLGSKFGQQAETSATSQPTSAAATGPSSGGKMTFGKPMFSRKQKGIMDTQDFPDIGDAAASGNSPTQPGASKANSAMMFSGGAAARGPRVAGEDGATGGEEVKAAATKPVFRGKAKFQTGGASNEEVNNSRMNYDFSKMRMSAATTKTAVGPDGERQGGERDGERREGQRGGNRGFGGAAFDDDDFEVVSDVKKKPPRRNFEEPTFGGGMPMFTRGGENRK